MVLASLAKGTPLCENMLQSLVRMVTSKDKLSIYIKRHDNKTMKFSFSSYSQHELAGNGKMHSWLREA